MRKLKGRVGRYLCATFVSLFFYSFIAEAEIKSDLVALNHPRVVIPKISGEVDLSKGPPGGVWRKAAWINNFVPENRFCILKQPTRAGIMYDDTNIYVGVIMDNYRPPIANSDKSDTGLMRDDAVEIIFEPPGFRKKFGGVLSLTLNPDGLKDDGINYNFKVNFKWDGRVFIEGNRWMAIFAVPFDSIGVKPKCGDVWGFNIARFIPDLPGLLYRPISWSAVGMNEFHKADSEGQIVFGNCEANSTIGKITVDNKIFFSGKCDNGKELICLLEDEKNNFVSNAVIPFKSKGAKGTLPLASSGRYKLKLAIIDRNNNMLNVDVKPILIEPAVYIKARRYPVHGTADIVITIRRMNRAGAKPGRIKVVWFQKGKTLGRKVVNLVDNKLPVKKIVDLGELSAGKVVVKVSVLEKNPPGNVAFPTPGSVVKEKSGRVDVIYEFVQPKCPKWANNKIAEPTDEPIKPWPAVKIEGQKICVWGRRYDFRDSFLPVKIESNGHQILAEPIKLDFVSKGKFVDFQMVRDSGFKVSSRGGKVNFCRKFKSKAFEITANVSAEYDGLIWLDIKVHNKRKQSVDRINIEIPLKKEYSTLQTHWPYVRGEYRDLNSMPVPDSGLKLPFVPIVWVGNTEAGLEWFAESDEGWSPKNPKNAIEIVKRNESTIMIIHYQDKQQKLEGDKHIRFGLIASPVKPWPTNYYEDKARILSGLNWGYNRIPDGDDCAVWYPLDRNISLDKGSIELVLEPRVDLKKYRTLHLAPASWVGDMKLLRINFSDGAYLELKYKKQKGVFAFYGFDKNHKPWLNHQTGIIDWQKGQAHKIALSWSDITQIFIDGKAITHQPRKGLIANKTKGGKIELGGIRCEFYLKSLKISNQPYSNQAKDIADRSSGCLFSDKFEKIEISNGNRIIKPVIGNGVGYVSNNKVQISKEKGLCLYNFGARTLLNRIKDIGAKYLLFFETWTNAENSGTSPWEDGLKEMSEDIHKLGMRFFLYFGFNLADVPKLKDIIDECKANPEEKPRIAVWQRPQHPMYVCTYASPYQDYLVYHINRLKNTIGIDGVYLDGAAMPNATSNIAIGNGYRDAQGKVHPIYPIREVRRFIKRLRMIFSSPDNIIVAHGQTSLPTLSHVDLTRVGENLMASSWDWQRPTTLIPLAVMKTIYYGRTFGIPQRLDIVLKHTHISKKYPNWEPGIFALAEIHDNILVSGVEGTRFPLVVQRAYRDLNVRTEFGASDSQWFPYWKVNNEISLNSQLKISLWKRKDNAMLAVISNLTDKNITDTITFLPKSTITPKKGLRIYDAVQDKLIGVFGGAITVSIPAFDYRIIRIGEKARSLSYDVHYSYVAPNAKSYYHNAPKK